MRSVLHICNCYFRSKVHVELFSRLDEMGLSQIIYVPEKKKHPNGTNEFNGKNTVLLTSKIVRPYHTYLFFNKIRTIMSDVERKIDLKTIDCCFATNLFSDGGVAYRLKKKYSIPYFVAVRTTDVNFYLKVPSMWSVARKILDEASQIIYIGPAIQKKLESHWATKGIRARMRVKSKLLPNGINKFWLDNLNSKRKQNGHTVIYVGRFMKNKNIENLLKAILMLRDEIPDVQLCLVGGGGELEDTIKNYAVRFKESVVYKGRINDKKELMNLYRESNVFAMISKRETFGLVYVEAMSQGLPILYTKEQGIDGFFNERIGEGVNPTDLIQIKDALKSLLTQTENYCILGNEEFEHFDWNKIALEYYNIIEKL